MNCLKKVLFTILTLLLTIEFSVTEPRKLKLSRTRKEVAQVFKTDDQQELAQEIKNIDIQTPQEKQAAKIELQKEFTKQKIEIKPELIKAQNSESEPISFAQALEIITSKKELSYVKHSSWTKSAIIKPFRQTYRLFLRVWNPKEYIALLENERKALEYKLNVQAYNSLFLLLVALDFKMTKKVPDMNHMFKKDNFYTLATHAFEGGALLTADIAIDGGLSEFLEYFSSFLVQYRVMKDLIKNNEPVIQSIWDMTLVIEEAIALKRVAVKAAVAEKMVTDNKTLPKERAWNSKDLHDLTEEIMLTIMPFDTSKIKKLCIEAAQENGQVLLDNRKSYSQYLKDWISEPKNAAKAGLVMAAIGGLYLYGPAVPQWLKDYTNSSVSLIKENLSQGYQTTISSMKNLWNKVRGYDPEMEKFLEDQNAIRPLFEAQEAHKAHTMQEFEKSQLAIEEQEETQTRLAAEEQKLEHEEAMSLVYNDQLLSQTLDKLNHEEGWQGYAGDLEEKQKFEKQQQEIERQNQEEQAFADQQQAAQMLNDFDEEVHADQFRKDLQRRNWEADQAKAREAESLQRATQIDTEQSTTEEQVTDELEQRGYKISANPTTGQLLANNEEVHDSNDSRLRKQAEAILAKEADDALTERHNKGIEKKFQELKTTNPEIPEDILHKQAESILAKEADDALTERHNKGIEKKFQELKTTNPEIPEDILRKQAEAILAKEADDALTERHNKGIEKKFQELKTTNPEIPEDILRKQAESILAKEADDALTERHNKRIEKKFQELKTTNPEISGDILHKQTKVIKADDQQT